MSQADLDNDLGKTRKPRETTPSTHDARPPGGVLVAHLEEISVALSFSLELPDPGSTKRRQVKKSSRQFEHSNLCDVARGGRDISRPHDALIDQDLHKRSPISRRPGSSIPVLAHGSGLDDDPMLDSNHSFQEPAMFSTSSHNWYSGCLPSAPYTSLLDDLTGPKQVVGQDKVSIESLAKLIDASFRTMIYGKKNLTTRGVKLTQELRTPMLAEIAPSVFSPGYLLVRHCLANQSIWPKF